MSKHETTGDIPLEKVSLLVDEGKFGGVSSAPVQASPNPAPSPSATAVPTSFVTTASWIFASVSTSVGIILVNKFVMSEFGFKWILCLTALHFLVSSVGMELMACLGFFKRQYMPLRDAFVVGGCGIGSIACMNFSLQRNSVGFYQVLKLLCIPCVILIQSTFYGVSFSKKIKSILVVILLGVGVATVTDVDLNVAGSIFGAFAVVFTAQFQIWQGAKQKEYGLSPMQINHALAMPSFVWCASLAAMFEFSGKNSILEHQMADTEGMWIFVSCVLSIAVNISSYGLIGATSPVTFQVVGHAKTCSVLLGGFYMYPVNDHSALLKNLFGIVVAMVGVVVYGNVKMMEGKQPKQADWLDVYLPQTLLAILNSN